MKSFEDIIAAEKGVVYQQANKDLFSFYVLTLISQERALQRTKKKLAIVLVLLLACSLVLMVPIGQLSIKLTAYVSSIDVMGFLQLALISYGLAGLGVLFSQRIVDLFD